MWPLCVCVCVPDDVIPQLVPYPITCETRGVDLKDDVDVVLCPPDCTQGRVSVFGTGIYASISSVCGAAVHRYNNWSSILDLVFSRISGVNSDRFLGVCFVCRGGVAGSRSLSRCPVHSFTPLVFSWASFLSFMSALPVTALFLFHAFVWSLILSSIPASSISRSVLFFFYPVFFSYWPFTHWQKDLRLLEKQPLML